MKTSSNNPEPENTSNYVLTKIDSAIFLTIASSCLYFFGYGYYMSYFEKLVIPYRSINLPLEEYLVIGSVPLLILFSLIIASFWAWTQPPKNKFELAFFNLLFFIQTSMLPWYLIYKQRFILAAGLLAIFCLILTIYFTSKKISLLYQMHDESFLLKLLLIVILFGFIFSVACLIGDVSAEKAIQGKFGKTQEIQLTLKDDISTQFENKTLILIMVYENNYYIIEKNETIKEYPTSYIIPSDQIKMATLKAIDA